MKFFGISLYLHTPPTPSNLEGELITTANALFLTSLVIVFQCILIPPLS